MCVAPFCDSINVCRMSMHGYRLAHVPVSTGRDLKTLVENRRVFTLERCELNLFETHTSAARVPLRFGDFVVTSMLNGKKVMHLPGSPAFDYFPGETVLVPAGIGMEIDFPEAAPGQPTQCIALAIDDAKIRKTLSWLDEKHPLCGDVSWQLSLQEAHLPNSLEVASLLNKIINLCSGDMVLKDVLVDLVLQELIVHVIQSQHRMQAIKGRQSTKGTPLTALINYIHEHLTEDITLSDLARHSCMSRSALIRQFHRSYGCTPLSFILNRRIELARKLLMEGDLQVKHVAYECGFQDVNYFIRLFRKRMGITPGRFQELAMRGD